MPVPSGKLEVVGGFPALPVPRGKEGAALRGPARPALPCAPAAVGGSKFS